ncbi:MAG: 2-amino-4-hydroxy-6-hydroxymethyldihydropteridine diphosphokinase [Planctomycetia bacterium]|nr:2-amino-4-hydroxy-6-hydroxymethyldihydropteridine diphosphokinase [Planctomycetia bacterium]
MLLPKNHPKGRDALIGFGANLGEAQSMFRWATDQLRASPWIERLDASRLHRTKSIGTEPAPDYWNAVFKVRVAESTTPQTLLRFLSECENRAGRARTRHWGARNIDLDLLLFGEEIAINPPTCIVPHPMIPWRRFVLEPALEIAPQMRHPLVDCSLRELYDRLNTTSRPKWRRILRGDFDYFEFESCDFWVWDSSESIPQECLRRARALRVPILNKNWVCRQPSDAMDFDVLVHLALSEYGAPPAALFETS